MPATLDIDIVSDVVCPWCIVGYRQLRRALAGFGGERQARIRWHPFELNPRMPPEGQDLGEHIGEKYGSDAAQRQAVRERLTALGEQLGFAFRFADDMRIYNTFDAHRLLHWAGQHGRQSELKLALFEAYFTHRANVSEHAVLLDAAERAGLERAPGAAVLQDGRYGDEVREAERAWLQQGITAVPAFVFERRYLVSGAQDHSVFLQLLQRVRDETA